MDLLDVPNCDHGDPCCIISKERKSGIKTVYVCDRNDSCSFRKPAIVPLEKCSVHNAYIKFRRFRKQSGLLVMEYFCSAQTSNELCGSRKIEIRSHHSSFDKENTDPVQSKEGDSTSYKGCKNSDNKEQYTGSEADYEIDVEAEYGTDKGADSRTDEGEEYETDEGADYGTNEEAEYRSGDEGTEYETDEGADYGTNEEAEYRSGDEGTEYETDEGVDYVKDKGAEYGSDVSEEESHGYSSNSEGSQNEETGESEGERYVETDERESTSEHEEPNEYGDESSSIASSDGGESEEGEADIVIDSVVTSNRAYETKGTNRKEELGIMKGLDKIEEQISEEEVTHICASDVEDGYDTANQGTVSARQLDSDNVVGFTKYRELSRDREDETGSSEDEVVVGEDTDSSDAEHIADTIYSGQPQQSPVVPFMIHTTVHHSTPLTHKAEVSTSIVQSTGVKDTVAKEDIPAPLKEKQPAQFKVAHQFRAAVKQLADIQMIIAKFGPNLPDKGAKLRENEASIKRRIMQLRGYIPSQQEILEHLNKPSKNEESSAVPMGASAVQRFHSKAFHGYSKELTYGAVQNLHSSLGSCPGEDVLAKDPDNLTVPLMRHQRRALAWLIWRESQLPSGGILADDMGLGKTLSMISLVLKQQDQPRPQPSEESAPLLRVKGTLVVAPLTLLEMWQGEISSKTNPSTLSVLTYHGPKRTKDYRDFQYYDIVITTYAIVGGEAASLVAAETKKPLRKAVDNILFKVQWRRVILDEAHNIRNPKTACSIGCCGLHSDHRWAMTGTPIQNKLEDFYSLIKFLKVAPFDDLRVWKDTIASRSTNIGMQRLKAMVSSLVLRRTKEDMMELKVIDLPKKTLVVHEVVLDKMEKKIYDIIFLEGRSFFKRYLADQGEDVESSSDESRTTQALIEELPLNVAHAVTTILGSLISSTDDMMERSSKGRAVLVLLLRLRQACCHLNLLCSALDKDLNMDEVDLTLAMNAMSLGGGNQTSLQHIPLEFSKDRASAKVKQIINELEAALSLPREKGKPNKCIIVSQWTSMFDILEHHLLKRGVSFTRIDGKVPPKKRQVCVDSFNSIQKDPSVMLLSLTAGGVGLTLTGANHVFIVDLHWNPQLEEQAADRCHRVGQTRNVVIHRFVVKDTVEIGIQALRLKKLELAQQVLSGASSKQKSRLGLTLADLKLLFEI